MIVRETVEGRPATVHYLTSDLKPSDPDNAQLIKVNFDDGQTMWAYPSQSEEDKE